MRKSQNTSQPENATDFLFIQSINKYDKQLSLSGTMKEPMEANANKTDPDLKEFMIYIRSQFSSVTQSCLTLCNPMTAACQTSLCITNSQSLLKLMSIESVMPTNHLIFCRPLLLLPSIFPSIRVSSKFFLVLHIRWPKYWSFSFSIVLPMTIQDSFPPGLTSLILQSKGLVTVFSKTTVQKHQFFSAQLPLGFPDSSFGKESVCNVGDLGSTPGLGRYPGEGKGYPFLYSGLENPMDCI